MKYDVLSRMIMPFLMFKICTDRYNVFFVASAASLSHNGILIRDLVQILVGDVGIVWILIEFACTPGG